MVEIKIVDNGGETIDRYTVTIGDEVYTMSQNPRRPDGFNQYAGKAQDFDSFEGEEKITINEEVIKAILERI